MRLADRVTVLRGDLTGGPYGGGDEIDWSSPTETDYPASVQPAASTEDVVNQQRTETRWRLFLPPYADLLATDRVLWESKTYEVDGEVEPWKNLSGRHIYTHAVLLRVQQG